MLKTLYAAAAAVLAGQAACAAVETHAWTTETPLHMPKPAGLTQAEVRTYHAQILRTPAAHRSCMAWLFERGTDGALQPFGMFLPHRQGALVKLDGAVVEANPFIAGPYDEQAAAAGRLHFGLRVFDFAQPYGFGPKPVAFPPDRTYAFHLASADLRISDRKARCTLARGAKCRRYVGSARLWWDRSPEFTSSDDGWRNVANPVMDITVEDTCPATTMGFVEGPWKKARTAGAWQADEYNRLFKGIARNPSLRSILK
jgi:hypothetical protein